MDSQETNRNNGRDIEELPNGRGGEQASRQPLVLDTRSNKTFELWKNLSWCQRTKLVVLALAGVPASKDAKRRQAAYRAARAEDQEPEVVFDLVDGYDAEGDRVDGILDPTDYTERLSCKPPPLFLPIISLVQIAVFIYYTVDLASRGVTVGVHTGMPFYSPLVYNPCRRDQAWRYLTYMFVHQGYQHLISNMVVQLFLGSSLELVHRWWRLPVVYCGGVIGGSLCHSIVDGNTFLVGASGGAYALIGARVANIILNWTEMQAKKEKYSEKTPEKMIVNALFSGPVQLLICAAFLLFAIVDFGISVYNRLTDVWSATSFSAHAGGLLIGIPLGLLCLVNIREVPRERVMQIISIVVIAAFVIFAVCWNIFYPGYLEPDWGVCSMYR